MKKIVSTVILLVFCCGLITGVPMPAQASGNLKSFETSEEMAEYIIQNLDCFMNERVDMRI